MPKSTATILPCLVDEEIPLVHVGVKEAVAQRMAEEGLDQRPGERARIVAERRQAVRVGERNSLDPLHRHDFAGRAVPVDRRRPDVRIVPRVFGELRRSRGLEPEIHLHPHRSRESLDDLDEAQAAHLRRDPLGEPRREEHVGEIAREPALDSRAQHFDRDGLGAFVRPDRRAVDLRDRGGGDRFAEAVEQRVDFRAERRLDDADRGLAAHRRHPILQALQFERDFRPDDVGPGRQKLAHLDVGRAEPVDGAGEAGQAMHVAFGDEICDRERQARDRRQQARDRRRRTFPRARRRSRRARA